MWGISISLYLFLAGVSAGAFAVVSLNEFQKSRSYNSTVGHVDTVIRRIGSLTAVATLVVGTLFLVIDARGGLSNPVAFFGLLNNWQSPMTWGVAIITVTLVLEILASVRALQNEQAKSALAVAGLVFATLLAAYTGLLLATAQPVPLWNSGALVILFVASAFLSGAALVLLVTSFAVKGEGAEGLGSLLARYEKLFLGAGIVEALALFAHLFAVSQIETAGTETVASLLAGTYALPFWLGIVVLGIAVPLLTDVFSLTRSKAREAASVSTAHLVGFASIIVGAAALRIIIVIAAQSTVISVL